MKDIEPYARPKRREGELKRDIANYLILCGVLTAVNGIYTPEQFWAGWIWIAWGASLILRAVLPATGGGKTASPRRAFYRHLNCYLYVMALLAAINYLYTPQYPWAVWPAAGWGFALALQAVEVFTRPKDGDGDYRM